MNKSDKLQKFLLPLSFGRILAASLLKAGLVKGSREVRPFFDKMPEISFTMDLEIQNAFSDHEMGMIDLTKFPTIDLP